MRATRPSLRVALLLVLFRSSSFSRGSVSFLWIISHLRTPVRKSEPRVNHAWYTWDKLITTEPPLIRRCVTVLSREELSAFQPQKVSGAKRCCVSLAAGVTTRSCTNTCSDYLWGTLHFRSLDRDSLRLTKKLSSTWFNEWALHKEGTDCQFEDSLFDHAK